MKQACPDDYRGSSVSSRRYKIKRLKNLEIGPSSL